MLLCLKCGKQMPDDHIDPCPGEDTECGAREWAWVLYHPFVITRNDYALFLKRIGVSKD